MAIKIDVVLPVYNEEKLLRKSVIALSKFLKSNIKHKCNIIIADNGSNDKTLEIAKQLSKKIRNVTYIHLDKKGRGRALRTAWSKSNSDILSYMDIDLSTDIKSFPIIIDALKNGYDIAMGSRLTKGARVKRSFERESMSRTYNLLLKIFFLTKVSDAQIGFKAIKKNVAMHIIPLIRNNNWFFDTELLILAEHLRYRIFETPVIWCQYKHSKVKAFKTIIEYIKNIFTLRYRLWQL